MKKHQHAKTNKTILKNIILIFLNIFKNKNYLTLAAALHARLVKNKINLGTKQAKNRPSSSKLSHLEFIYAACLQESLSPGCLIYSHVCFLGF
jgi:hypothetical protein